MLSLELILLLPWQAAAALSHLLSPGLCPLHLEADFTCGKDVLLANPGGLASAAHLEVGTSLLPAPQGC